MFGYIILVDIPKNYLTINKNTINLSGNFLGFKRVPPGRYQITVYDYSNQAIPFDVEVFPDAVVVRVFDHDMECFCMERSEVEEQYAQLAKSGALDHHLLTMPTGAFDEVSSMDMMEEIIGETKTSFHEKEFEVLNRTFEKLMQTHGTTETESYIETLKYNYVVDGVEKFLNYYLQYADILISHLQKMPSLANTNARIYYEYLIEDLKEVDSVPAQAKAEIFRTILKQLDQILPKKYPFNLQ